VVEIIIQRIAVVVSIFVDGEYSIAVIIRILEIKYAIMIDVARMAD
jgi:hypothetical protein